MMHIPSLKEVTKEKEIVSIPDSSLFYLPLNPVAGKTPVPIVETGEYVKMYQLLARMEDGSPAPLHAPVSGIVKAITLHPSAGGDKIETICIENDFREEPALCFRRDGDAVTNDELMEIIQQAGILGQGGAEFPAAIKYKTKGKEVKTFIVNGAECEPYLTADYALMSQRTQELLEGIQLVNRILDARDIVIAIEEQNRELAGLFRTFPLYNELPIRTVVVPDEYPQGGELQLIYSVTGKELPNGTIPLEAGIVMNNVSTLYAVRQAVVTGEPAICRILTVSGEEAGACGNYEVKTGTPVRHILQATGSPCNGSVRVLLGGPMMGKAAEDLSVPVTQGSNGLLILPYRSVNRLSCIHCGYCVDECPMDLMPFKYDEYYRNENWKRMKLFDLDDCIECACCEYICPVDVPLMTSIRNGKKQLKRLQE